MGGGGKRTSRDGRNRERRFFQQIIEESAYFGNAKGAHHGQASPRFCLNALRRWEGEYWTEGFHGFFLGWQTRLEEDVLQSNQVRRGILREGLFATRPPPRGDLFTYHIPRLRIFQVDCLRSEALTPQRPAVSTGAQSGTTNPAITPSRPKAPRCP